MGYRELLQALEEEVGRQIRERRRDAEHQQRQILQTTRAELAVRREKVLAEERHRLMDESAGALSRARLEAERTILVEMRRWMTDLRSAAEARLPAMNDSDLLTRLVEEMVPELGEGALLFRVKEGYVTLLENHLRLRHPDLLVRSVIEGSPDVHGGVEVSVEGRQRLDNTLHSRLQAAWERLEPDIAARLFGRDGPASPRSGPVVDTSVEVAIVGEEDHGAL